MFTTSIYFVRHGQVHNPQGIIYGRLPRFSLSREGIQQAKITATFLSSVSFSAAYSSPMLRAKQTAKIILNEHNYADLKISHLINEPLSPFQGLRVETISSRNWDLYKDLPSGYDKPQFILSRVKKFIEKVRNEHSGKDILAVTHGDVIATTLLWTKNLLLELPLKFCFPKLGYSDSYPMLASVSMLRFHTLAKNETLTIEYINPCNIQSN